VADEIVRGTVPLSRISRLGAPERLRDGGLKTSAQVLNFFAGFFSRLNFRS